MFLGETIVIGTSITNDFYINDIFKSIFNGNKCDYFKYFEIVSISIGFGTDYAIKNYSKILGNKNILVGLDTMEDYIKGDIYKNVISIDEMIEETINLMNSK